MADQLDYLPLLSQLETVIPPFTVDGVLVEGDYAPTRSDFEDRFVSPLSLSRPDIYSGWNNHREALIADGLRPECRQLLNGSFTTAKTHPNDIDLAVEVPVDAPTLSRADPIVRLLHGRLMKSRFRCDAYPLFTLPLDHPDYDRVT